MEQRTLTDKQRGVLRGMLPGLVLTVVVLGLAVAVPPGRLVPAQPFPATLERSLTWDVLLPIVLAVHVGLLARHRFFSPDDIDGSGLTRGTSRALVLQAALQNTLEQSALAFAAHSVWAAVMPLGWQAAVPAAALLFVAGRVLFLRGYAKGAPFRALGFSLTFYPTVVMLAAMAVRLGMRLAGMA